MNLHLPSFLKRYAPILLFAVPVSLVTGLAVGPVGLLAATGFALIWALQGKRDLLAMWYLVILILGDARTEDMDYWKTARITVLLILTIQTIVDLQRKRYRIFKGFSWIWPFFLLALVSLAINSQTPGVAFQKTLSYLLIVFIAFHFYVDWLRQSSHALTDLLQASGLVMALGLIIHYLTPAVLALGDRYQGLFGNPNGLGLFCLVFVPFFIKYYHILRKKVPTAWYFYFGTLLLSLVLSGSRNSLMGVLLYLGLLWWFHYRSRRLTFFFVLLPSVYLLLTSIDIPALLVELGLGEALRAESIVDGSGRLLSWTFALGHIPDHFWMGGGFAHAEFIYDTQVPEALQNFRQMGSTWNSYLTLMLNNGLIGTIAFLIFIFAQIRYAKDRWSMTAYVIAMLLSAVYETWLTASLNSFSIYFFISLVFLGTVNRALPNGK